MAFPSGYSEKQKTALLDAARRASAAGVPYPFMAHALHSDKINGALWERIDRAKEMAQGILEAVNRESQEHFEDLTRLVDYVQTGGNGLPASVKVGARTLRIDRIAMRCRTWPGETNEPQQQKETDVEDPCIPF